MSRVKLLPLVALLGGCAHLASVSVTPVPVEKGIAVQSTVESPLIWFGATGNHDYVDDVVANLREQCKGGKIQAILTKHEVIHWPFAAKHRITASGRCVL